jgi:transposase
MKQRIPKAVYSKEFREQAVKQVTDEGLSLKEAASRLLLPPSTLDSWLKAARNGKLGEIGKAQRPLTEIELELARTKRELAEVKMERDLLKKAAAYFAKGMR